MDVPQWQMDDAKAAYEAYVAYAGGKSLVSGDKLPTWDNLPGSIKNAWHAAAMSVLEKHQ